MPLPDGVFAATLTPMHADLRVNHPALVAHCRWLLDRGCDGIALLGTTGEANSLSVPERKAVLEAVLEGGLPAGRILVGTGCCALPDTIELTRHAVACGVPDVLMLPPFYYKNVRDDGLFAAFDAVIQAIGAAPLRIFLYHFPQMTGVPFSNALLERLLAAYPGTIAGMKDSSGDAAHMLEMVRSFPGFRVYAGTEQYLLDILEAGGAGCISATANVTSPLAASVARHWQAPGAHAAQQRLREARLALQAFPFAPALKHLIASTRNAPEWRTLRPPLAPLRADEASTLDATAHALSLDL